MLLNLPQCISIVTLFCKMMFLSYFLLCHSPAPLDLNFVNIAEVVYCTTDQEENLLHGTRETVTKETFFWNCFCTSLLVFSTINKFAVTYQEVLHLC